MIKIFSFYEQRHSPGLERRMFNFLDGCISVIEQWQTLSLQDTWLEGLNFLLNLLVINLKILVILRKINGNGRGIFEGSGSSDKNRQ